MAGIKFAEKDATLLRLTAFHVLINIPVSPQLAILGFV